MHCRGVGGGGGGWDGGLWPLGSRRGVGVGVGVIVPSYGSIWGGCFWMHGQSTIRDMWYGSIAWSQYL